MARLYAQVVVADYQLIPSRRAGQFHVVHVCGSIVSGRPVCEQDRVDTAHEHCFSCKTMRIGCRYSAPVSCPHALSGSLLSGVFAISFGMVGWLVMSNTFLFLGFVYILIWIEQVPPSAIVDARRTYIDAKRQCSVTQATAENGAVNDDQVPTAPKDQTTKTSQDHIDKTASLPFILTVFCEFAQLTREAWQTFVRPRKQSKRKAIWVLAVVTFFVAMCAGDAEGRRVFELIS